MERYSYLIVGGGLAAARAVEGIRREDGDGSLLLIGEEEEPPYHRPPLSKEFLQTPEAERDLLLVKPSGWLENVAGVELALGTRVVELDPRSMSVTLEDGTRLGGDRILLATGGKPRRTGVPGEELAGVTTFRTVEDAEALREAAASGETGRVVLVGAGFIGMELAASLRQLEVEVTVVEREDRVWPRVLPPPLSDFFRDHFEERGVRFRLGAGVQGFRGQRRVEAAVLDDGSDLPCDRVIVGVGIEPEVGLAVDAGLAVQDGIVVDARGESSHGYVYATGDVARYPDPVFGDLARVEHWDHARVHGRMVGRNMAGAELDYEHLSYFFSDVFELSLNVLGRPAMADRTVLRGPMDAEEGGIAFCAAEGRLCAAVLVDRSEEMGRCRELVRQRPPMEKVESILVDPGADLTGVTG